LIVAHAHVFRQGDPDKTIQWHGVLAAHIKCVLDIDLVGDVTIGDDVADFVDFARFEDDEAELSGLILDEPRA